MSGFLWQWLASVNEDRGEILASGRAGNGNAFKLAVHNPVHLGLDTRFQLRDLDGVVCYFNTGAVVAGLATVFFLKSWKSGL